MDSKDKGCQKCGGVDFDKKNACKACKKAYQAAWRIKNAEHIKAYREANKERDLVSQAEYRARNLEIIRQRWRDFKEKSPESIRLSQIKYYEANKEICKQRAKKHYEDNKEEFLAQCAEWARKNPEKVKAAQKKWKDIERGTPIGRLKHVISARVRSAVKASGYAKKSKTHKILGCDWEFFRLHIERQFTNGMCWEKMGSEIHIDHIVPISAARDEDDVLRLNHFTNLRPLWARDNLVKNDKLTHLI